MTFDIIYICIFIYVTPREKFRRYKKANSDAKVTWFSKHDCDAWKLTRGPSYLTLHLLGNYYSFLFLELKDLFLFCNVAKASTILSSFPNKLSSCFEVSNHK